MLMALLFVLVLGAPAVALAVANMSNEPSAYTTRGVDVLHWRGRLSPARRDDAPVPSRWSPHAHLRHLRNSRARSRE
jgi:hypothetical protein